MIEISNLYFLENSAVETATYFTEAVKTKEVDEKKTYKHHIWVDGAWYEVTVRKTKIDKNPFLKVKGGDVNGTNAI